MKLSSFLLLEMLLCISSTYAQEAFSATAPVTSLSPTVLAAAVLAIEQTPAPPPAPPITSSHLTRTFLTTNTRPPPPPPRAVVTDAPEFDGDVSARISIQQKWHLTTYYECVTFGPGRVDCGWHEPVLPGGDEIAAAGRVRGRGAMGFAFAAGALAAGALLR